MEIRIFGNKTTKLLNKILKKYRPRIIRGLNLLKEHGPDLGFPHSRPIGKNLLELRIKDDIPYRFFYCFHDQKIWILHVITKKTIKTPKRELDYAHEQLKLLKSLK